MSQAKAIRLPGETPKCRDCGDEFSAATYARFCPKCRPLHLRPKRWKYPLDGETIALLKDRYDSRVRGRLAEIARQLGWPKWAVKKAGRTLGLAKSTTGGHEPWSAEEIGVIRQWAGLRTAEWIGHKLHRSETSVVRKMRRMAVSRRVAGGYGKAEISLCFGVDHRTVSRWIQRGWLRVTMAGGDRSRPRSRFSDGELRRFVRSHPLEFLLEKVDQVWFLGLILGVPLLDEQPSERSPVLLSANQRSATEEVKAAG